MTRRRGVALAAGERLSREVNAHETRQSSEGETSTHTKDANSERSRRTGARQRTPSHGHEHCAPWTWPKSRNERIRKVKQQPKHSIRRPICSHVASSTTGPKTPLVHQCPQLDLYDAASSPTRTFLRPNTDINVVFEFCSSPVLISI